MIKPTYFKSCYYTKDLHCDKCFDFDLEVKNCLRNMLGNCLYDELILNLEADGCTLIPSAPKYIIDLVEGLTYESDVVLGGCKCLDLGNCKQMNWRGLRGLVALCIEYKWLCDYAELYMTSTDKQTGQKIWVKKPLHQYRIDVWNKLTQYNNVCTKDHASLHRFISDHKEDYPNFKGFRMKLQNYLTL
jgi:hypothetical protein